MKTKTVYSTRTGAPEAAYESPLEPGVFHLPAGTVEDEPPQFDPETQVLKYDGKWIVEDIPQPEPEPEPEPYVPTYADLRREAYGSPAEQIEYITENGLTAWKAKVADIKARYPKPEA